ncbi:hypothetical protein FWF89_03780, partial [Candidatus Saccharibacteria bacterium]|nr:hypothetical protein [Candidatus Saccharibacteria bacterium]
NLSVSLIITFAFSLLITTIVGIIVNQQSPTSTSALPPTPTITYTGPTGGAWTTGTNWDTGVVPASTDDVLIPSLNVALVIPDNTNVTVNSLTLTGNSILTISSVNTGTLQVGSPIITKLITTTDIYLEDTSQITSPTNTATTVTPYTVNLDVGGLLSIATNAKIDVTGKGFAGVTAYQANPGNSGANIGLCTTGSGSLYGTIGGQYGGQGGLSGTTCTTSATYGDFMIPIDLGSGGRSRLYGNSTYGSVTSGAGAIRVNASSVVLNGSIVANGTNNTDSGTGSWVSAAGAGGAIYVTANQVSGTGSVNANGGNTTGTGAANYGPGGGGRIAIVTTGTNSLADSQYSATSGSRGQGGYTDALAGAAGTIYIKNGSSNYGNLIISNANRTASSSSARTGLGSNSPYQFDSLTITNGGRINLTGNLTVTSYNFQGNYSSLIVSGTLTYTTSNNFILNTNNFYLTVGSLTNTNTNLTVQNTSNNPSNTATGNQVVINSSQSLNSVDINNDSGIFTVNGNLTIAQGVDIASNSSTNTITGDLAVADDVTISGNSSTNTINGRITATNLYISGTSANSTVGSAYLTDDIALTDGTTTICSITATTSGSGAGLTTSLNTINVSADNLTLSGTAVLTHCTNTATATSINTLNIDLSGDLTIPSGASIDVTGKGYAGVAVYNAAVGNSGANIGACNSYGAIGGQYGGQGGLAAGCIISGTYGNFMAPIDLGSGGRSRFQANASSGSASAGGGAININASSVIIDGSIVANGVNNSGGGAGANSAYAAGSGGAIYITADQVSGAGNLQANGGSTTSSTAGGSYGPGGGGRIAVITTSVNSLTTSQYQAASGARGAGGYGGTLAGAAGTIYIFDDQSSVYGTLIITNANHAAADTTAVTSTISAPLYQYDELVITQGGRLSLSGNVEFTNYDFQGDYSTLITTGSMTYTTSNDFVIDTNYFTLDVGSIANINTNFIIRNSNNNPSNTSTGNKVTISSSQQLNSVDVNNNSGTFIINGDFTVIEDVNISGNSSTNTFLGDIDVGGNLALAGAGTTNTVNGVVNVTEDIILTDGVTTICSTTASTIGSGAGLTTSLNIINISATNLELNGAAVLTHCTQTSATATSLRTLNINLSDTLIIASGARIDVASKGYSGISAYQSNPGNSGANIGSCTTGSGSLYGAVGGQYGGQGGLAGTTCNTTESYGDFMAPTDLGSGGRVRIYCNSTCGSVTGGGGAVRINANSVTLDGSIIANGTNNSDSSTGSWVSAAGAGGAIYITADTISGMGNLISNGGNTSGAGAATYGPGGGGRIAVITTGVNSLTTSQYQAASGSRGYGGYSGTLAGAAGTIYIFDSSSTYGTLIIGNANHAAADTAAWTSTVSSSLYQYDELVVIEGGRLNLNGDLEFTAYDFQGNYSTLTVSGYMDYTTSDDFILDTNNFYITVGSIVNTSTNLIARNTSAGGTSTGNKIIVNSSQQLNSVDINNNSGIFTINGSLTVAESVDIVGNSSTNTITGTLAVTDDINISGNSTNNTISGLVTATNLNISGTSHNSTINNRLVITDDITLTDGTTTVCSITATTSGSGAGLTTSLNTVNVSADNLMLNGTAILTHCTNTATATSLNTLNINLNDTLSIASGASINVNGKGYAAVTAYQAVPGNSGANVDPCTTGSGSLYGAVGGQYGGIGGQSGTTCNPTGTYGNYIAPIDLGSGGRARIYCNSTCGSATSGAGAVRVNAGAVIVDGSIIANGINNNDSSTGSWVSAAGAGGGIYITAGQVSGNGNLTANGGNNTGAGAANYGPGGGGRIAINNGTWITSIDADHGLLIGGNTVTISGGGFADGTGVIGPSGTGPTAFFFGGKPATNVVFLDEHTATMRVPAGDAPGEVDVVASNNNSDLDGITLSGNITVAAGTRAAGTGTAAEVGTIFMRNSLALSAYTYNDATMAIYLDDICAGVDGLILSLTPLPGGGAISNGSCTANVFNGDPNGFSLSISTDETTWDIAYPLQPIGNGTTTGILSNPIALTPGTIGFAFPTTQTNSTGLVPSNFNATYPIVHSLASASHTNLYARIPTLSSPLTIKTTTGTHPDGDFTTLIIGGNANMTIPTGEFSFTLLFSVVGN